MDEACASARVSQDLKPEAIDGVEQGIIQLNTRIAALEVRTPVLALGRGYQTVYFIVARQSP